MTQQQQQQDFFTLLKGIPDIGKILSSVPSDRFPNNPRPVIVNTVCTASVLKDPNAHIDLRKLYIEYSNLPWVHQPNDMFALGIKIAQSSKQVATIRLFSSGCFVLTGATTMHSARYICWIFTNMLRKKCGYRTNLVNFGVRNIVCKLKMGYEINLVAFHNNCEQGLVAYEAENFPAAIYRPPRFTSGKAVVLVYGSGNLVITGASSKSVIKEVTDHMCQLLDPFRKNRVSSNIRDGFERYDSRVNKITRGAKDELDDLMDRAPLALLENKLLHQTDGDEKRLELLRENLRNNQLMKRTDIVGTLTHIEEVIMDGRTGSAFDQVRDTVMECLAQSGLPLLTSDHRTVVNVLKWHLYSEGDTDKLRELEEQEREKERRNRESDSLLDLIPKCVIKKQIAAFKKQEERDQLLLAGKPVHTSYFPTLGPASGGFLDFYDQNEKDENENEDDTRDEEETNMVASYLVGHVNSNKDVRRFDRLRAIVPDAMEEVEMIVLDDYPSVQIEEMYGDGDNDDGDDNMGTRQKKALITSSRKRTAKKIDAEDDDDDDDDNDELVEGMLGKKSRKKGKKKEENKKEENLGKEVRQTVEFVDNYKKEMALQLKEMEKSLYMPTASQKRSTAVSLRGHSDENFSFMTNVWPLMAQHMMGQTITNMKVNPKSRGITATFPFLGISQAIDTPISGSASYNPTPMKL